MSSSIRLNNFKKKKETFGYDNIIENISNSLIINFKKNFAYTFSHIMSFYIRLNKPLQF